MIKIKIRKIHKSISPCEFEIPNFSVLTGLNGSGKTHLLEAISDLNISEVFVEGKRIRSILYIPFNGLNPQITEKCDPTTITQFIKNISNNLQSATKRMSGKKNIQIPEILRHLPDPNTRKPITELASRIKKNVEDINEEDIFENFDVSFMGQNDFFTGQFALIFKNYHKLREDNRINRYYHELGYKTPTVLSDSEFEQKNGLPPWDFVNKILVEINIPYIVNSPEGTKSESSFDFKLIDKKSGIDITSKDLSTGEKVLMSLALAIYNAKGITNKPEFLLIDEPDAALHPSMSKKMVNILKQNIVLESNIPAIITSHSPTTIISADGISIYQMERGNSVPIKIPTQKAVEILSTDIPFLKISTDRRRQVFVESKYDVIYYELITNILLRIDTIQSEPIYIPARTSNGSNCQDVIEVVTNLHTNGNEEVFGIIDWDTNNEETERIILLGNKERYAIENYLLDPLLMGFLFIREAKLPISYFGINEISTYSELRKLTETGAQKILDKILDDLNLNSENKLQYVLNNTWNLKISKEFCLFQGHDLEAIYKARYPFLNIYRREDALKKDVIQKIINDFPEFTPQSIFDTIKKIK
ncbi:AAA family ATPase [Flavobacterium sp. KACC 22758]|uniref:AAA family ATPase n=1 Tax=Flavobacterium sp. KACC 22758 TaxID=3025667 RepID=UPI0023667361|nr:AAA family ATPase [Flavobacterium sp. KACC 22758]WDF58286.1 AAA family ATPase [Flavobacterium sp. KACC 22758]